MLTTFSGRAEFERAARLLGRLGVEHDVISPDPGYAAVGCPALVLSPRSQAAYLDGGGADIVSTGWVDYRPARTEVPDQAPPEFADDIFGRVAIVVLAPCMADADRLRLIAHFSGDVAEALPYLNAEMNSASYVAAQPVLTHMDGHRIVSLFRDRIGIAKADDIVDAWATLERARRLANDVWSRRDEVSPPSSCAAGRRRSRSTSACRARTAAYAASRPARRLPGPSGAATLDPIAAHRSSAVTAASFAVHSLPFAPG